MKRYLLFGLLVTVVCTPLFFVLFLLTAANVPALDRFTLTLSPGIRAAVAQLVLATHGGAGNKQTRDRALKLNPDADVNGRAGIAGSVGSVDSAGSELNQLNALGLKQEVEGDPCAAEDTFTKANSQANGTKPFLLRNMGRAAYKCGRYPYSVAGFSAAEDHDAEQLALGPDNARIDKLLATDREWLSLAYTANHQPQLANEACLRTHTGWKACKCTFEQNHPLCIETPLERLR